MKGSVATDSFAFELSTLYLRHQGAVHITGKQLPSHWHSHPAFH